MMEMKPRNLGRCYCSSGSRFHHDKDKTMKGSGRGITRVHTRGSSKYVGHITKDAAGLEGVNVMKPITSRKKNMIDTGI
jgi:hypothetical protein